MDRPINAEIVTIGTELLLGEISDTNSVGHCAEIGRCRCKPFPHGYRRR